MSPKRPDEYMQNIHPIGSFSHLLIHQLLLTPYNFFNDIYFCVSVCCSNLAILVHKMHASFVYIMVLPSSITICWTTWTFKLTNLFLFLLCRLRCNPHQVLPFISVLYRRNLILWRTHANLLAKKYILNHTIRNSKQKTSILFKCWFVKISYSWRSYKSQI